MRILFLGNNWVGWQVLQWMKQQGEQIVGLVVHPVARRKYGREILQAAAIDDALVFDGAELRCPHIMGAIRKTKPEIAVSALFGYILRREFLDLLPAGCINIHPALLPWNRGAYPNVWSIADKTPSGVTIHYIDEGTDTGDIIAQREVEIEPVDTGESLYRKLERASLNLFTESWPAIRSGSAPRRVQDQKAGTYHQAHDVERLDEIDLTRSYKAEQLIDLIRARTFPPYPGAYFLRGGRKVYLRLQLQYGEQSARNDLA